LYLWLLFPTTFFVRKHANENKGFVGLAQLETNEEQIFMATDKKLIFV
jgi:hypothetical protein